MADCLLAIAALQDELVRMRDSPARTAAKWM